MRSHGALIALLAIACAGRAAPAGEVSPGSASAPASSTDLDPVRAAVAGVIRNEIQPVRDAVTAANARIDDLGPELKVLDGVQRRVATEEARLDDMQRQLQKANAAQAAIVPNAPPGPPYAGLLAGGWLVLLALGLAILIRRESRAILAALAESTARLAGQAQRAPAPPASRPGPPIDHGWLDLEVRFRELLERFEGLEAGLAAATARPAARPSPEPATEAPSETETRSIGDSSEPVVASRLLWPPEFLDSASPLARWRYLAEQHLGDRDHSSLPVLASLLCLRTELECPDPLLPEVAAASFRLSEALLVYLHSLPDLSPEDRQQANTAWLQGVRQMIGPAAPRLELREIMSGARVDTDLMHATSEGSGNHLNVADVYSWAVIDRSADRPKVLHRARIGTT
jgi:hypothetical protein